MAQIDRARLTGRKRYRALCAHLLQLQVRHAGFAGRREEARHVDVRADADACRRIVVADVGEQEQHQQGAAARHDVHAPGREVLLLVRIAILAGKAQVDMPAGIAGIVRMREAHRERCRGRIAAASGRCRRADRRPRARTGVLAARAERRLAVSRQADHRPRPRRRVVRIAGKIAPHDGTGFVGELARKGVVDPDEAVADESPEFARR